MGVWKCVRNNVLRLPSSGLSFGLFVVGGFTVVLTCAPAAPTREAARSLQQKVAVILQLAEAPARQPRRTTVTDHEINSYLAFDAGSQIPAGVVEPELSSLGNGRVSARAVVDLDAVRGQKSQRSLLDPMNFLMGRVAVTATGTIKASDGIGRVEFETASIGPIPVPKIVLQEIVGYYTRTAERPSGLSLDDAFALPARIRAIQVEAGHAVVIQ